MANDNELLIRINGNAKDFINELDKTRAKTKDLQKSLETTAKVSAAAFVGLAGAVGLAVNEFVKFERTFSNVQTLLDKSSFSTKSLADGVNDLKNGVLDLGAASGESFEDLNKGLFDVISATGDAENALEGLEAATKLAVAGGTDVSVAVDGITTAVKAFNLNLDDAQVVAEKFFQAQKGGKTTVEELAGSIGRAASTAAAYNVSLDELLAASSAATLAGINTAESFSGLKAAFASISKPTADAIAEARRLGVEFNTTALRSKGLEGFLNDLTNAQGFTQQSIERLFGSVEAQNILFALTGAQAQDFARQIELLGDAQGSAATFADALATKQETADKALDRLNTSAKAALITFGELFAPAISSLADSIAGIASSFRELDDDTIKTLGNITKFFLAITGGVAVFSGLGLAFLKIQGLLVALRAAFTATRISAAAMWGAITLGATAILTFLPEIISGFKELFGLIEKTKAPETAESLANEISRVEQEIENAKKAYGSGFLGKTAEDKRKIKELEDQLKDLQEKKREADAKDLEAARVKAEKEAEIERKKQEKILEDKKVAKQAELDFDREFSQLSADERAAFSEQEKADLLDKIKTEQDIKDEDRRREAEAIVTEKNKRKEEELKSGKEIAGLNAFFRKQEVKEAENTAGLLIGLQQSKNKEVKAIGKAAASVQIGIDTAKGAIAAYSSLAGIPFVGPALGAAAAAAVIAFGGEQLAQVNKAQQGGVVPGVGSGLGSLSGARDRSVTLTEPGEIIVPRALAPNFVEQFGRGSDGGLNTGGQEVAVTVDFAGDAAELLEQRFLERRAIGVGSL